MDTNPEEDLQSAGKSAIAPVRPASVGKHGQGGAALDAVYQYPNRNARIL